MKRLYSIQNASNPKNWVEVDLSKILFINKIEGGGRYSNRTFPITLAGAPASRDIGTGGLYNLEDHRAFLVAAWRAWTQYIDLLQLPFDIGPTPGDESTVPSTMEIGSEIGDVMTVAIRDILHVSEVYASESDYVFGVMIKRDGEIGIVTCDAIGESSAKRSRQLILDTVTRHRNGEIT